MPDTKDPLLLATPDRGRELFTQFAKLCHGFGRDDVKLAAVNLLINAIRQEQASWGGAEAAWNDLVGRGKQVLSDHYDSLGRKRGIFPYDQTVVVDVNSDLARLLKKN